VTAVEAMTAVRLRPADGDDEDHGQAAVARVFQEVRGEQFRGFGLTPELLGPLLDVQFRSQQAQYRHAHPQAVDHVLDLDGQVVGRCYVDRSTDGIRVLDLAVLADFRRRGIASRVMADLLTEAAAAGCCLHLSVWSDNMPARRLYEGLGFVLRAERPDGYLELCCPGSTDPAHPHACPSRPDTSTVASHVREADAR
jgi:ribosomal protein S18 acetylase RimI-like enzyme